MLQILSNNIFICNRKRADIVLNDGLFNPHFIKVTSWLQFICKFCSLIFVCEV